MGDLFWNESVSPNLRCSWDQITFISGRWFLSRSPTLHVGYLRWQQRENIRKPAPGISFIRGFIMAGITTGEGFPICIQSTQRRLLSKVMHGFTLCHSATLAIWKICSMLMCSQSKMKQSGHSCSCMGMSWFVGRGGVSPRSHTSALLFHRQHNEIRGNP